jgi:hypothetical protein
MEACTLSNTEENILFDRFDLGGRCMQEMWLEEG